MQEYLIYRKFTDSYQDFFLRLFCIILFFLNGNPKIQNEYEK